MRPFIRDECGGRQTLWSLDNLRGHVSPEFRKEMEKSSAKREAEELAGATKGVRSVRSEIRVVSAESEDDERYSDSWITGKVKAKLAADPQINPFNIDVDTEDGRVTLSGIVSSDVARTEAAQLARDTKGVHAVDNEIAVE